VKDSVVRELRAVQRYSVNLPVCVTWRVPDSPQAPLNCVTRDISTRGMFVVADAEPAEGALLEFEIDLALDEATPLVVVRGEGRVVRTQRSSERVPEHPAGFAVHNVWFRLGEPEQGQALPADLQTLAAAARPPVSTRKDGRHRGLVVVPPQVKTDSNQGES
jgi:PilZ domain